MITAIGILSCIVLGIYIVYWALASVTRHRGVKGTVLLTHKKPSDRKIPGGILNAATSEKAKQDIDLSHYA